MSTTAQEQARIPAARRRWVRQWAASTVAALGVVAGVAIAADVGRPSTTAADAGTTRTTTATATPQRAPTGAAPTVRAGRVAGVAPVAGAVAPATVEIPRIGVRSSLVRLGLDAGGAMEVPADFARAGWLTTGPVPGDVGPAVIGGHVDSRTGPAVFARLGDLGPGDRVLVRRADGRLLTFVVDRVRAVAKDAFPTRDVYGPVPAPELRLITCGGSFDRSAGHYRQNVVVWASLDA